MNLSIKNIEKLLLESNELAHEDSKCIDCKADKNVSGGVWIKQSDIPTLDEIGQPVYMDEENVLLYPLSHDLIIGSTGSGKTTVLYDNCIDFYSKMKKDKRPSFLAMDLKGDLYTRHTKKLEKAGYKVRVIDMRNPFFSASYNPLSTIFDYHVECCEIEKAMENKTIGKTYRGVTYKSVAQANSVALARYFELKDSIDRYINELAEIIVVNTDPKNLSWTEGGRSCLKAILYTLLRDYQNKDLGMTKEKFTLDNVARTSFTTDDSYEYIIKWLRRAEDITVVSGALGACYDIKAQVTRDGYTSSLNAELNKYSSVSISALTAKSDVLVSEIAESKEDYAIFLITDSRAQITNNIAMMFMNDLINTLSEKADKNPARCLDKDFVILADEMGNLPQVPGMSNKISTLRSRKIWMHMSVQSLEQLDQVYGEKVAATILDNCDIHMFLGCNNDISKKRFAESMGEKEGLVKSAGIGDSGVAQVSVHTQSIPVVRKSDLGNLKLGEFYVRSRVSSNLKSAMIPYFLRKDVDRSEVVYELEYNGFDPEANRYYIKETLALEGLDDDDFFGKPKTTKKKKISIVDNFKKIASQDKINEQNDDFVDDGIEFTTDIEKNVPQRSYANRMYSDSNKISAQIYYDMKSNLKKNDKLDDKIISTIALGILPIKIQRGLASDENRSAVTQGKPEFWLPFFKKDLLFDIRLKQQEGKQATLNELERRINELIELDCFSPEFINAYREVKACISKMTDIEFIKYRTKITSRFA